jgi:DNA-binding response OmpR family regulator
MRVLVVEDDPALRLGISRMLQAEGWQVDIVTDGEYAPFRIGNAGLRRGCAGSGSASAQRSGSALALAQPGQGSSRAHSHRQRRADEPGSRSEQRRRRLFAKPFEPEELVARLRAITRRRSGNTSNLLSLGRLRFNTDTKELHSDGERLALSPREAALLELLMSSHGSAVPKARIISAMSSWESNFSANSVEIYILKLRRKLAPAGVNIVTLRGVGYALELL